MKNVANTCALPDNSMVALLHVNEPLGAPLNSVHKFWTFIYSLLEQILVASVGAGFV